ncbi:MAG: TonB-dependent receptor [Bacteroides sp.]|nr:TonB-dependent receptor [Bacteroides sp.]MCM1413304.1 TonB-dependent receptor [Bacteroides sp.]MCM1471386.1 TonB-dependent receptor [Bacteroides sp.]
MRVILLIISLLSTISPCIASDILVYGMVTDRTTGEPLPYATIKIEGSQKSTLTDSEGLWKLSTTKDAFIIEASYVGYVTNQIPVTASADTMINIALSVDTHLLGEVVVTAQESNGLSSSSRIDRDAMSHLQPTSFTDLLELLPGNISQTPDMGRANTISLRETGNIGASGAVSDNPDYAITSLGTPFIVDGTPIGSDGNLSDIPGASSGDAAYLRSTVNRGVDMRSISTDNIESVEVIRGIPSAEYGNLTSGVVNIKRIRRASPWTARFKADEYSKLFSVGKGFNLGNTDHVLNIDGGYLDSKVDPRNNLENYKRVNASVRGRFRWAHPAFTSIWNIGVDYTGSFDNAKVDPDLNQRKIDEYKSSYNRYALTSELTFTLNRIAWLESVGLNTSVAYVNDRLTRRKDVTPNGTPLAPTSMEEGVHDGKYLLTSYLADFVSDGRPVDIFTKLRADGSYSTGPWLHDYKAGAEWTFTKNYGRGQIYDLDRPLNGSWTTRPRAYRDIPALHTISAFIEDGITTLFGNHKLEAQLGVRMQMLPSLDNRYYLSGHPYFDPRINAKWSFPSFSAAGLPMQFSLAGGYGLTTKMPTLDYLFPQVHYADFVQLGYYDINDPLNLSSVNLRTYITDPTNYDLHAARNRKWEVRMGIDWGKNRLSVTYFRERMNDGYRYSAIYDAYEYRRYDAGAIVPGTLTAPPTIDNLPYTDMKILDGYNKVTNGTRINKQGIELQLSTARWKPLATALTVTGAWFRSLYSNSQLLYYPISTVIGNTSIRDKYVGIYDTTDGRINDRFSANFMFDTQIPRWGLIFTTTIQCVWWTKTRRLPENGVPVGYISADDGQIHPFTDADAADPLKQHLIRYFNSTLFDQQKVPTALYVNLKATKQLGKYLRISAYVNRILDYLPDYKSNGITIRRNSEAYFGMEMTITI